MVALLIAVTPRGVDAITPNHVLGGWWESTNPLDYQCIVSGSLHDDWCDVVVEWGANSWRDSNFNFRRVSGGAPVRVWIHQDSSGPYFGSVRHYPHEEARPYSSARMYINRYQLDSPNGGHYAEFGGPASTGDKQCVASHEFGHVIGLAHHDDTYSIMTRWHRDRCGHGNMGGYGPAEHDETDVWWLYNVHRS